MQKTITQLGLSLLLFLTLAGVALAKTQTYCVTGGCAQALGGGSWVLCTTYDEGTGQVVSNEGTNCMGDHWIDHCSIVALGASAGNTSDYYIAGPNYWIRFNVDSSGNIASMWGQNSTGMYWKAEANQSMLLQ